MLQISEIVRKTEEMFDLFNAHFYEGELSRPAITVSPDGGRGAYGWCSINEIWNASGEKYREINLCAEYLDRPIFALAATLLHEMAHLYNLVHGIQDVSNNGYYHNQKFKATAEAHGLHIEKHAKYGWTVTTLAPEAEAWIRKPWARTRSTPAACRWKALPRAEVRNPLTEVSNMSALAAALSSEQRGRSM